VFKAGKAYLSPEFFKLLLLKIKNFVGNTVVIAVEKSFKIGGLIMKQTKIKEMLTFRGACISVDTKDIVGNYNIFPNFILTLNLRKKNV